MRKLLRKVPLYIPLGQVPAEKADAAVSAGHAHSLRGKAVFFLSRVALEDFMAEIGFDPEEAADVVARILRAQRAVIARQQAGGEPSGSEGDL